MRTELWKWNIPCLEHSFMYWSRWSLVAHDSVIEKLRELMTLSGVTSRPFWLLKKTFSNSLGLFMISSRTFSIWSPFLSWSKTTFFLLRTVCSSRLSTNNCLFFTLKKNYHSSLPLIMCLHCPFSFTNIWCSTNYSTLLTHVYLLYFQYRQMNLGKGQSFCSLKLLIWCPHTHTHTD